MTKQTTAILEELSETDGQQYDQQVVSEQSHETHEVVITLSDEPATDVGDPLTRVSYSLDEDKYAVFSGERTRGGYDVSYLEETHEDVSKAVATAVELLTHN